MHTCTNHNDIYMRYVCCFICIRVKYIITYVIINKIQKSEEKRLFHINLFCHTRSRCNPIIRIPSIRFAQLKEYFIYFTKIKSYFILVFVLLKDDALHLIRHRLRLFKKFFFLKVYPKPYDTGNT